MPLSNQCPCGSINQSRRARAQDRRAKKRARERFIFSAKTGTKRPAEKPSTEAEGEQITAANSSVDERLSLLTHLITLDHLEKNLGLQIIPEDRLRIERQFTNKLRDPAICSLINQARRAGPLFGHGSANPARYFRRQTPPDYQRQSAAFIPDFLKMFNKSLSKCARKHTFYRKLHRWAGDSPQPKCFTASHNTNYPQQK